MPNKYREAHAKMRRAGADPRRADPRLRKVVTLTVRQTAVFLFSVLVLGLVVGAASVCGGAALAGLRVASSADIRLIAIIRAAVPTVDAFSQDDLVGCLSIPPQVGRLLALLVATDPARVPVASTGWLDGLKAGLPVTTPERMLALGEIASALAPLPDAQRLEQISSLVDLYETTRDPSSRTIITAIEGLHPDQRDALTKTAALGPILSAVATIDESNRQDLSLDPERIKLALSATSDLTKDQLADLSAGFQDDTVRSMIFFVIKQHISGNISIDKMLTDYWYQMQHITTAPVTDGRLHHDR